MMATIILPKNKPRTMPGAGARKQMQPKEGYNGVRAVGGWEDGQTDVSQVPRPINSRDKIDLLHFPDLCLSTSLGHFSGSRHPQCP